MPFINVKTNVSISKQLEETIKAKLGQAIEVIPGKSEDWLMVGMESDYKLWFKGTNEPAAFVDVTVFGAPNPTAYEEMTKQVCEILKESLQIRPDRTYVKYAESVNWGWNNQNF